MCKPWKRYRFRSDAADCRPVLFPPPGPWWRSGYDANDNAILIAYLPADADLKHYWPEAFDIEEPDECDGPEFTSRFPEPEWWRKLKAEQEPTA